MSQSVREAELAVIHRAAAVAGVQPLLAQAFVTEFSPEGFLSLPCVAAGAGGSQQGVSGDS